MTRKPKDLHDHALWDEVKRSILPLLRQSKLHPAKSKADVPKLPFSAGLKAAPQPTSPVVMRRPLTDAPPPLAQLDRRTAQRLNRGQIEPEARLDLHGENLETARIKLMQFLSSERQQGTRFALVITGKGASLYARHTLHGMTHFHTPEREGRLRREVPLWLNEDGFRRHVVAFQPAHPKHGGGGAFYIRLRKLAFTE